MENISTSANILENFLNIFVSVTLLQEGKSIYEETLCLSRIKL